jgi:aryl-alcohol dehydrogenase-like predicted oxidoreductase
MEMMLTHMPELNCKISHLALAWVARNKNTGTVILGATKPEQLVDNLKALEVIPKLTPEVLEKIEKILNNKPTGPVSMLYVPIITAVF